MILAMKHIIKLIIIFVFLTINDVYCLDETKVLIKGENNPSKEKKKEAENSLNEKKNRCQNLDNTGTVRCLMNCFLTVYDINPNGFCSSSDKDCKKSVQSYTNRCASKEDDCHLLDNIELVKLGEEVIMVPDLIQAEVANFVFKESGAYKSFEWPSCSCAGQCTCHCDCSTLECEYKRDVPSFIKTLTNVNKEALNISETNYIGVLRSFVYYSALYYNELYLKSGGSNCCSGSGDEGRPGKCKSYNTRKEFGKMRRNTTMQIYIPYPDIHKLVDELYSYLFKTPVKKNEKFAWSFTKIFRYTLIKSVPYYKHSYLFADYVNEKGINVKDFSDPNSPDGDEMLEKFIKRCKEGECYMFDDYFLYSKESNPKHNYLLPQLSEVNLVFYLLSQTNFKYGKINSWWTNTSRPHAEIKYMSPRLLEINKQKFNLTDPTDEIIQSFLYYCSIYFVKYYRENLISRLSRHIARWNAANQLAKFLKNEGKDRELNIEREEIDKIGPAYKEYLLKSHFKNHAKRVDKMSNMVHNLLVRYLNNKLTDINCCNRGCIECQ